MENNVADGVLGAAVAFLLAVVTTPGRRIGRCAAAAVPGQRPSRRDSRADADEPALQRRHHAGGARPARAGGPASLAACRPALDRRAAGHRGGGGRARGVSPRSRGALCDRRDRAAAARCLAAAADAAAGRGLARPARARVCSASRWASWVASTASVAARCSRPCWSWPATRSPRSRPRRWPAPPPRRPSASSCSRSCHSATGRTSRRSGGWVPRWERGVRPAPTSGSGSSTGSPRCSCAGSSGCSHPGSVAATPSHSA